MSKRTKLLILCTALLLGARGQGAIPHVSIKPTDKLRLEVGSSGRVNCTALYPNDGNTRVRFMENNVTIPSGDDRISVTECPPEDNLACTSVGLSIGSHTANNSHITCDCWNPLTGDIIVTSDPVVVEFVPAHTDPPTSTGQPISTQPNSPEPTTTPHSTPQPVSRSSSEEESTTNRTKVIALSVVVGVETGLLLLCVVVLLLGARWIKSERKHRSKKEVNPTNGNLRP